MIKLKQSVFYVVIRIFSIVVEACPLYILFVLLIGLGHGISKGMVTLYTQKFFDSLSLNSYEETQYRNVIGSLLLLVAVIALTHIFTAVHNATLEDVSFKMMKKLSGLLHKKSSVLSPVFFEDPKNLNMIERAKEGVEHSTYFMNILFTLVTFYIPYFVFLIIYLFRISPILTITILMVFIPVSFAQYIRGRYYVGLADYSAIYQRKFEHYEECLIGKKFFKETRLLGAYSFFYNLYTRNIDAYNQEKCKVADKSNAVELIAKMITLSAYAGILLIYVLELLKGSISIGAFVALVTSVNTMFSVMQELICKHIGSLSESYGNIRNYISFLEYVEDEPDGDKVCSGKYDIEMKNVSFVYPDCEEKVLNNVSIHIKAGEFVAIVGENGAGKTTMAKLLCGMYLPTEGMVKIGGIDTKEWNKKELFEKETVVLQKFQKYFLCLSDNVYISDTKSAKDVEKIEARLADAGFCQKAVSDINREDPILAKEFGGIELSGGQWQKVALARGTYKKAELFVLDEPTAAIDPIEETRLYRLFQRLAKGKTTLFITHRLGAARLADRIIVISAGKIEECGTHEELMKLNGKYAQMCLAQSQRYV